MYISEHTLQPRPPVANGVIIPGADQESRIEIFCVEILHSVGERVYPRQVVEDTVSIELARDRARIYACLAIVTSQSKE